MQTQAALRLETSSPARKPAHPCRVVSIDALAAARRDREQPDAAPSPLTLRCVHSGYLADGGSCEASVPAQAATNAWQRERLEHLLQDGFFRFQWRGQVWLGYGLADGSVRGVYCPGHNAERSQRYYRQSDGPASSIPTVRPELSIA